ncbi:DNA repair protein RecN [Paenibacillus chungangensis]|uniref:DNA repair protein RecN n=1 Tax=Paenibacillus chungangensis TaxID=696535 RepID=A0ABW3HMP0_9BACL
MLRELSIRNLAVLEEVNVSFHNGFHVLTGETGAGKSILIDALSLIVGGRGSADMIRHGRDKAEMEAMFDMNPEHPVWSVLERLGLSHSREEMLIIRRELTRQGKSSSRVNGQLVTMTMLREIGECLVNIHGQHEHQSLLRTERHLEWLDAYGGDLLLERKGQYGAIYKELQEVRRSLQQLSEHTRQNEQMLDLYRFQVDEIQAAALKPGEDEALAEERKLLLFADKRMHALSESYSLLNEGGGLDAVRTAVARLVDTIQYDEEGLGPILEQLQSAFYQAEDAAYQLREYREGIDVNPERLAYVDDRLDMINGMKRKYGESIPDILSYLEKITSERDKIENKDEWLDQLRFREDKLYRQASRLAEELSALRRHASKQLSEAVVRELRGLEMPSAEFQVELSSGWNKSGDQIPLHSTGTDEAVFMLTTNPGEPLKPLNKIASGGEMSRIMLALKSIFAEIDHIPVLIFDEVDTGVSGRAAQAIAEKLSRLAGRCQVFSITHLPQVACMSDHHYEIKKTVIDNRTSTSVMELQAEGRINELARMLGGVEVTEKTKHHAQEMLDLAHGLKGA